jgi:hypothetical protein
VISVSEPAITLTRTENPSWALEKARIKLLEPCSPQHPASLIACASGNRERWASNAFDARRQVVGNGGTVGSEKIYLHRGDYITLAEKRGNAYWLLAGSEIQANAVASACKVDRIARVSLLNAGLAANVLGFPDPLSCSSIGASGAR